MNILFVGGYFPRELRAEIMNNSIGPVQNAADAFQWSFIKGLEYHCEKLNIFTLPFIGAFPFSYKKFFIKKAILQNNGVANNMVLPFLNVYGLSHLTKYFSLKAEILKWIDGTVGERWVLIYSLHSPFLKAAISLKNQGHNIKICIIIPDMPQYMSGSTNIIYRFLKKLDAVSIRKSLRQIDASVLLTDSMAEALDISQKPFITIEGIFDETVTKFIDQKKEVNKTVLYTGTLDRRFGIVDLLDAFDLIKDRDYRLWICGAGDSLENVIERTRKDERIVYLGQLQREEVLMYQKRATVLVNPRSNEGDYTKFSFPSKTMEYMASGTPCILKKLDGIPSEYFQHSYICEDDSLQALAKILINVCEAPPERLREFGYSARSFIINEKNSAIQVGKVYKMLKNNKNV